MPIVVHSSPGKSMGRLVISAFNYYLFVLWQEGEEMRAWLWKLIEFGGGLFCLFTSPRIIRGNVIKE